MRGKKRLNILSDLAEEESAEFKKNQSQEKLAEIKESSKLYICNSDCWVVVHEKQLISCMCLYRMRLKKHSPYKHLIIVRII